MYARHAEIRVGLLVLGASVALLGFLYYATGGSFFREWRYVHLRFEPGNLAPEVGDKIQVNGVDVGYVDKVGLRTEYTGEGEDRKREIYVHVVAKLNCDQACPVGTRGIISESVTMNRVLILIPGTSPENLSDEDTVKNPILVSQRPDIGTIAQKVSTLMEQAGTTVTSANETLQDIRRLVGTLQAKVEAVEVTEIVGNVRDATASLKRTAAGLEKDLAVVGADLRAGLEDFKRLAASIARLSATLEKEVPAAVADVREVVGKVGGVVDRAAPKVDAFLDDVNRVGKNLVAVSEDLTGLGSDARGVVKEAGSDLDVLAEVLIDTGRNLLDASEDLRAHPWKLLNEPSVDEIEYENLRTTMQNYVRAMQKMETTARTLKAVLERGDAEDPTIRALIERILSEFEASVDRYRAAEKRLMELLQQHESGGEGAKTSRPR